MSIPLRNITEVLGLILDEALKYHPNHIILLKLKGDLQYGNLNFNFIKKLSFIYFVNYTLFCKVKILFNACCLRKVGNGYRYTILMVMVTMYEYIIQYKQDIIINLISVIHAISFYGANFIIFLTIHPLPSYLRKFKVNTYF